MTDDKLLIIGIHGLANKPEKATLKAWWKESIDEGLKINCGNDNPEFDFEMVHWSDLLYKNAQHSDPNFDFDKLYNEQPHVNAVAEDLKTYADGWKDELRRIALDTVASPLDWMKEKFNANGVADWVLEKTAKDLAFYYDPERLISDRDGNLRVARQVLMDELRVMLEKHKDRRCMLIAHSMGTIIAYDVLRDLGRSDDAFDIAYFVTIGSPLGLPHVKAKINAERKGYSTIPVRTPSVVSENWINFADKKDPVALDAHLSDDYGVNDGGVAVKDDLVYNDYVSPKGDRNHHKSYGYLRTPEMSEFINGVLRE